MHFAAVSVRRNSHARFDLELEGSVVAFQTQEPHGHAGIERHPRQISRMYRL
jgi:hypothetical protein